MRHGLQRVEVRVDLPAEQIVDGGGRAAVADVGDLQAQLARKERGRKVRAGTHTGIRERQPLGRFARVGQQLIDIGSQVGPDIKD
ncbi:hypothetical protein D3C85_1307240 [compost metagenome]